MNGGQSWTTKPLPFINSADIQRVWISVQFLSPSIGYIATTTGIYKTSDTGTTWKCIYPKLSNCLHFTDQYSGLIYTTGDSIYRTTDGGDPNMYG